MPVALHIKTLASAEGSMKDHPKNLRACFAKIKHGSHSMQRRACIMSPNTLSAHPLVFRHLMPVAFPLERPTGLHILAAFNIQAIFSHTNSKDPKHIRRIHAPSTQVCIQCPIRRIFSNRLVMQQTDSASSPCGSQTRCICIFHLDPKGLPIFPKSQIYRQFPFRARLRSDTSVIIRTLSVSDLKPSTLKKSLYFFCASVT